ncbi:MAG: bifunctional serine/threonine-protein kinase/formylglycine-generating enzyme family protein [Ardenticatenaceae bacterium]
MTNTIPSEGSLPASHFGDYEVAGVLGSGQYGNVYLARDKKLWRWVVLSVLHPHLATNKQLVKRFIDEGRTIAGMRHPNLVTVLSIEQTAQYPYIVMEFVEGVTLESYLRQRTLSIQEALPILRQLAAALDAIHNQKMVHMDVRPANVLIGPAGNVLLTNVGLVKLSQTIQSTQIPTQNLIDKTLYISPEQAAQQKKIGSASDIYALGVIAYEILAGRAPFVGSHDVVLTAHLKTQPPDPRLFNRYMPPSVSAVLQKALNKKPANRYRTASAFVNALARGLLPQYHAHITGTYPLAEQTSATPLLLLPPALASTPPQAEPANAKQGRLSCLIMIALATLLLVGIAVQDVIPMPWSTFLGPEEVVGSTQVGIDGMVQVHVPAGEFLMGSAEINPDAQDHEFPQHVVYLDAFWIDQTEVTNGMYAACVEVGKCKPPGSNRSESRESYYNNPEYNTYPVIWVSWQDARNYCEWAERRLPSEAEWEKAARGTDGQRFPWGNERPLSDRANYCDKSCPLEWKDEAVDDQYPETAPVGHYKNGASPYGALDMGGNVWEWVADWYDPDYYKNSPERNPTGPTEPPSAEMHVVRGGSWNNDASTIRAAARSWDTSTRRDNNWGFRCADSATP